MFLEEHHHIHVLLLVLLIMAESDYKCCSDFDSPQVSPEREQLIFQLNLDLVPGDLVPCGVPSPTLSSNSQTLLIVLSSWITSDQMWNQTLMVRDLHDLLV